MNLRKMDLPKKPCQRLLKVSVMVKKQRRLQTSILYQIGLLAHYSDQLECLLQGMKLLLINASMRDCTVKGIMTC